MLILTAKMHITSDTPQPPNRYTYGEIFLKLVSENLTLTLKSRSPIFELVLIFWVYMLPAHMTNMTEGKT